MRRIAFDTYCRYPYFCGGQEQDREKPNFELSDEGYLLLSQWLKLQYPDDKTISGILADWLVENMPQMLATAEGTPEEAMSALGTFIANLRLKCFSTAVYVKDVFK